MNAWTRALALPLSCLATLVGCGDAGLGDQEQNFSSDQAVLLDFEFDGELVSDRVWDPERLIEDQMLYTIGQLNGSRALGRLDKLQLSNIERVELDGGQTLLRYHAKLPVGWAHAASVPEIYTLQLPRHGDSADYQQFTETYGHTSCVEIGAHDVDTGSMWYYYRPDQRGCELDPADVVATDAVVRLSEDNTEGKYPEYHKVWEDDALTAVAIFGKYEDGATSHDAGITAYNRFVRQVRGLLEDHGLSSEPAEVPEYPGVDVTDITFRATLPDGRSVEIVTLLVDNVRTAGFEFDQRYEQLSGNADLIAYNGHAGLGANIRALADKGTFLPGKYQIFFFNGCDTFAYVDNRLAEAHAAVNPDDPTGTRHLDMVTNVMPTFASSSAQATGTILEGLLSYAAPRTYEEIFADIDHEQVIVVTGEEDNVYQPEEQPRPVSDWPGVELSGAVPGSQVVHHDLGVLPAGTYLFEMSHDPNAPDGDADLYLAVGRAPSLQDWDERPYEAGSDEAISIFLEQPAQVVLMVAGYEAFPTSPYLLVGKAVTE